MRPNFLRRLPGIGACAALFALAGCISFGPDPTPTLFSLTADEAAAVAAFSGRMDNAILVEEPSTGQRLAVLRVPVQIDASNVAYLKDASWVEKPSRQFRGLIAETLRARSGRLVFEDDSPDAAGTTAVMGRLLEMGYDAPTQSVVVKFDGIVRNGDAPAKVRRFEARVPGVQPEAAFVGPALNQAANDVAQQVADWVIAG